VAAGQAVWTLGTDTGGSVRQPAALSGVVGMKPTYGLNSRYGLIAFASSLDTVSTFTRDVRDAAVLLSAIAGHDPMDSTSIPEAPRDYTEGLEDGVKGLRIGVLRDWLGEGVQDGVRASVEAAVERLERLGAEIGIDWTDGDGATAFADRPDVERLYLGWLGPRLSRARVKVRRGERSVPLGMPPGVRFATDHALATVLGPRDEAWLDAAIADARVALDITPWWADATDAEYLLDRGPSTALARACDRRGPPLPVACLDRAHRPARGR
jgi:hypothetical protein